MKSKLLFVASLLLISAVQSPAQEIKMKKAFGLQVLSIDRRPDKDATYTKCVGLFQDENDKPYLRAVKVAGDRACPAPDSVTFEEKDDGTLADAGKTRTSYVQLSTEVFERRVQRDGKLWKFNVLPAKSTVKVPSASNPAREVEDTFCIARIKTMDSKPEEKKTLGCDDCSSLERCFATPLETKNPLTIGGKAVAATLHSHVSEDTQLADISNHHREEENGFVNYHPEAPDFVMPTVPTY